MKAVNPEDLATVASKLNRLNKRFAFVGGCVLPLLMDSHYVAATRPTKDVDVVVEALTRMEFSRLEMELRSLGFRHDIRVGAPRCRWLIEGIMVDIMPASPDAAEFGSRWFEEALTIPETHEVKKGMEVNVIGPSYLLATKLDAFFSRGSSDYYGSRDLEDVVALLEGCSRLLQAVRISSSELQQHLSIGMRQLLDTPAFVESYPAHLSQEAPQGTVERVLDIVRSIAELGK